MAVMCGFFTVGAVIGRPLNCGFLYANTYDRLNFAISPKHNRKFIMRSVRAADDRPYTGACGRPMTAPTRGITGDQWSPLRGGCICPLPIWKDFPQYTAKY